MVINTKTGEIPFDFYPRFKRSRIKFLHLENNDVEEKETGAVQVLTGGICLIPRV